MARDFHNKPFDNETILKLQIFKCYIREWLPVFLSRKSFRTIYVFDFFAGPGRDSHGQEGSPLIIIDEVKKYLSNPELPYADKVSIKLFFNDDDRNKTLSLEEEIRVRDNASIEIEVTNKKFREVFEDSKTLLKSSVAAKLLILDQSGIKHITDHKFKELVHFPVTDFMFFVSSSTVRRFINVEGIRQYFPTLTLEEIRRIPSSDVHRYVYNYYHKLIPDEEEFYLSPFSIKKGPNIYGIIFGSGKLIGLEKFLKVCWNLDNISGEANYDIDNDIIREGKTLFKKLNVPKKIDLFKRRLIAFLEQFKTNNELYKFTLENGCLPRHTFELLCELQKDRRLEVSPSDTNCTV
jgi:three-Cys-motif partner protein